MKMATKYGQCECLQIRGQYRDQGEGQKLGFDNSSELSTSVLVGGLESIDVLLEDSKIWLIMIRKHFLKVIAVGNLYWLTEYGLLVRKGSFEVNAQELI